MGDKKENHTTSLGRDPSSGIEGTWEHTSFIDTSPSTLADPGRAGLGKNRGGGDAPTFLAPKYVKLFTIHPFHLHVL